jgi:hypothetical protein
MLSPLDKRRGILVTAAIRDISVRQAAEGIGQMEEGIAASWGGAGCNGRREPREIVCSTSRPRTGSVIPRRADQPSENII